MHNLLLEDFTPDWAEMRKQKQLLLAMDAEVYGSTIHLLDYIQDQAEESGIWTEEEIFGKKDQYFEWEEKYKPVKNHFKGRNGSYDDMLFETYGEELEYVLAQNPKNVWTLLCPDDDNYIVAGIHHVNRQGYFITEKQWTDENEEYYDE